jgi:AcrR family transcriptional regulator
MAPSCITLQLYINVQIFIKVHRMRSVDQTEFGLRERKKQQTRRSLTDAALRLFAEKGYDKTTVADIAAAADVSTRTFFSYFKAKEDVFFAGTDQRMAAIAAAFDAIQPDSASPMEALRRLVDQVLDASQEGLSGPDRLDRVAFLLAKPELQAQALHRVIAAEQTIAERLRRAYPDQLDNTLSHTMAGAVVGALIGIVLSDDTDRQSADDVRAEIRRALTLLNDGLNTLH